MSKFLVTIDQVLYSSRTAISRFGSSNLIILESMEMICVWASILCFSLSSNFTAANCFDHIWVSFLEFMFGISKLSNFALLQLHNLHIFRGNLTNFDLLQYLVLPRALFFPIKSWNACKSLWQITEKKIKAFAFAFVVRHLWFGICANIGSKAIRSVGAIFNNSFTYISVAFRWWTFSFAIC